MENTVATVQAQGLVSAGEMKDQILALFDKSRPGFEGGVDIKQITIPRVRLLQGLSPEVKNDAKNFAAGMIINSITKEVLPRTFIPLVKMPTTWVRFNARDRKSPAFVPEFEAGAMIWRSDDPNDPRVKEQAAWGPNNEPPLAIEFMNFLCYFEGFTLPAVLSFSRSSYAAGKEFFTMSFGFGGAMYSRKYELTAHQQSRGDMSWYAFQTRSAGKCTPDEALIGQTLMQSFGEAVRNLKVHEEDAAEEAAAGAAEGRPY